MMMMMMMMMMITTMVTLRAHNRTLQWRCSHCVSTTRFDLICMMALMMMMMMILMILMNEYNRILMMLTQDFAQGFNNLTQTLLVKNYWMSARYQKKFTIQFFLQILGIFTHWTMMITITIIHWCCGHCVKTHLALVLFLWCITFTFDLNIIEKMMMMIYI